VARGGTYSGLYDALNNLKFKIRNDKDDLSSEQVNSLLESVSIYNHEFALANTNYSKLQAIISKDSALTDDEVYILKNCLKSFERTKQLMQLLFKMCVLKNEYNNSLEQSDLLKEEHPYKMIEHLEKVLVAEELEALLIIKEIPKFGLTKVRFG